MRAGERAAKAALPPAGRHRAPHAAPRACRARPGPHRQGASPRGRCSRSAISAGRRANFAPGKRSVRPRRVFGKDGHGAVGVGFKRRIRPLEPARQQRQPGGIEALGGKRGHQRAQPGAGKARVAVGGVVGKGDLRRLKVAMSRALGSSSSGRTSVICCLPIRQPRHRRHRREPGQPAAAAHADQHRLGLIVERVRGEDVVRRRPCARRRASSA